MERENEIDLVKQNGGTVYTWDDEDRFYRDVVIQIKAGKRVIYIYNRTIMERIQEEYPDITIKRREFYWEVINDETKYHTI